jgi:hypothetical protein
MTYGIARAGSYLDRLGAWMRQQPLGGTAGSAWLERRSAFARADAYARNTVYAATDDGGYRDDVNRTLGNARAADLAGLYNPVAAVIGLYQHVFGGTFGTDVRVVPGRTGHPSLPQFLADIWQWSNMTIERQPLCQFPATYGTAGLRIVADARRQRVYLKVEHPAIIRDVEMDDRGNVIGIELEYDDTRGLGDAQETITIREVLTRETFTTYRVSAGATLTPYDPVTRQDNAPGAQQVNPFGVVPYVLVRHGYSGDAFGAPPYTRALPAIDRLNALLSHIDVQVHQHVRASWMVAASGAKPEEFDMSGRLIIYFNTAGGTSPPVFQSLLTDLSIADATAQARFQLSLIEDLLPELKAIAGTYLAGQSGETVAELRKPAEDAVLLARANYEDALIRAQQIALSYGVWLGIFDLGTGAGPDAADRAYHEGLEDHTFVARPGLTTASPQSQPAPGSATPETADAAVAANHEEPVNGPA